jgi:hypothetical protein
MDKAWPRHGQEDKAWSNFRNIQCMCCCNVLAVLWPSTGSLPRKFFLIGALSFLSSLVALHARKGGERWAKRIPLLREKENNAKGCLCPIFALRVRSAEWRRRVGWCWDRSITVHVLEYTLYKNHVNQLKPGRIKTTCLVTLESVGGGRGRVCLRLSVYPPSHLA